MQPLGSRMKWLENTTYLTKGKPLIVRVDGKSFRKLTKKLDPDDIIIANIFWETAKYLCQNIPGAKIAYTQSDEISLLVTDYNFNPWFNKDAQKIATVVASMATMAFNNALFHVVFDFKENEYLKYPGDEGEQKRKEVAAKASRYYFMEGHIFFYGKTFVLPEAEVCNYFIWRQQDAYHNIREKYPKFALPKNGVCIVQKDFNVSIPQKFVDSAKTAIVRKRWVVEENVPTFSLNRNYIEQYLE